MREIRNVGYIGMCRYEGYGFQAVSSRMGYTPPERGTFFRPQVYIWKGRDFTSYKVYKRLGKSVIWVCKEGLTDAFYGCEKKKWWKLLFVWFIKILKTVYLQQFKGMQSSKVGMSKGYSLSTEGIQKGYWPFLSVFVWGKNSVDTPRTFSLVDILVQSSTSRCCVT